MLFKWVDFYNRKIFSIHSFLMKKLYDEFHGKEAKSPLLYANNFNNFIMKWMSILFSKLEVQF